MTSVFRFLVAVRNVRTLMVLVLSAKSRGVAARKSRTGGPLPTDMLPGEQAVLQRSMPTLESLLAPTSLVALKAQPWSLAWSSWLGDVAVRRARDFLNGRPVHDLVVVLVEALVATHGKKKNPMGCLNMAMVDLTVLLHHGGFTSCRRDPLSRNTIAGGMSRTVARPPNYV